MPGGIFDINSKINELSKLSIQLQDEKIWSDRDKSLELSKKRSSLEKEVSEFTKINDDLVDLMRIDGVKSLSEIVGTGKVSFK